MQVKMRSGKVLIPVNMETKGNRIEFAFQYAPPLMEEIKAMKGRKYHGYEPVNPRKTWSVEACPRNNFAIEYLMGGNPYKNWEQPLAQIEPTRPQAYAHQVEMMRIIYTYHYVILAAEMGTGKTLSMMMAAEAINIKNEEWWYVAPTSALNAVWLEFYKWKCSLRPRMMTYDELKKVINTWKPGDKAPRMVTFDESSRCKTPMTQRTQASQHLADAIRYEHGWNGFVIEMSGSPAPKAPTDWWSQCEIAYPGFIREGDWYKFRDRLAFVAKQEFFQPRTVV